LIVLEKLLADLPAPWAEVTLDHDEGGFYGGMGNPAHAYVSYAKAFM